jgi:hypothetical protein
MSRSSYVRQICESAATGVRKLRFKSLDVLKFENVHGKTQTAKPKIQNNKQAESQKQHSNEISGKIII